jgi:hypothetical protein
MKTRLNVAALAMLAPVLIVSGVVGLVRPGLQSTSDAPAYQIFHIVFGAAGVLIALSKNTAWVRSFNVGFGVIDLYQALASRLHLFPDRLFRWTRTDDALHVGIGVGLLIVSGLALSSSSRRGTSREIEPFSRG